MQRVLFFLLIMSNILFADTFVHKETKKTFAGYCTNIKKQEKTLVRTKPGFNARYINCNDYEIKYNLEGRRNKVVVLYLDGDFSSPSVIDAVKERLDIHANQGPFLIALEIGRIEEDFLSSFESKFDLNIANKIQKTQSSKIVAIIKEKSDATDKIVASCNKAYYPNNFDKISDVYSQIAKDFSLEKFKVNKDRHIAKVQKKYLSTKEKVKSLWIDIDAHVKVIENSEKQLVDVFSRYRTACDQVDIYKYSCLDSRNTRYRFERRRRYLNAKKNKKRLRKECDNLIKNIISYSKKTTSKVKTTLFYAKRYPEFSMDSNTINLIIKQAKDANKKASGIYKAIH